MNYTSLSEIIKTKPNSIVSALSWPEWLSLTVAVQHPLLSKKKKKKKTVTVKDSEVFCANPPRYKKYLFKVYYKIQISQFQTKPSALKSVAFAHKHTKIMVHTGVVVLTVLVIQFSEKLIEVVLVRNPFVL